MKTFITVISVVTAFLFTSCSTHVGVVKGKGKVVTQDIALSNFSSVNVHGNIHVIFRQTSGKQRVTLMARENLIDMVEAEVNDGTLSIGVKKSYVMNPDTFTVMVQAPDIKSALVTGSGMFEVKSPLKCHSFDARVTGSGDILTMDIDTKHFDIAVNGSGDIVTGDVVCTMLSSLVSGSGDIHLSSAKADNIETKVTGSGTICLDNIEAQLCHAGVTGSGDIKLSGIADTVDFFVTGSGEVKAARLRAASGKARTTGSGDIDCSVTGEFEQSKTGSGNIVNQR